MQEIILISAVAAFGGLALGVLSGAWFIDRKFRRRFESVRDEVQRLSALAEEKLAGDDPNLDELLDNLRSSMTGAYGALQAMKDQAIITKRKSEGGRQVIATSKQIIRMIDEQTGGGVEIDAAEPKKRPPKLSAPVSRTDKSDIVVRKDAAEKSDLAGKGNKIVLR